MRLVLRRPDGQRGGEKAKNHGQDQDGVAYAHVIFSSCLRTLLQGVLRLGRIDINSNVTQKAFNRRSGRLRRRSLARFGAICENGPTCPEGVFRRFCAGEGQDGVYGKAKRILFPECRLSMTSSEVRARFIAYFSDRGHQVVPSASLIPEDDPTLLFTNAGMVQFKKTFLGEETRPYLRAVSAQKCIRAGGKHNDLDNVGQTARHHTFFEMLGNFSFGDYFKTEAIAFAWELLTQSFHLPPERLSITIFRDDDEAGRLWEKFVPAERIIRLDEKDNFWQMGDVGPCGPCSEVMFDQGEAVHAGCPGIGRCDCDRYLEIWNLVFMQYNRDAGGKLTPLPKPSIDTGMGLERMTAVCRGALSNYDTDLFHPLFAAIARRAGREPETVAAAMPGKVIADHLRALTFMAGDGVIPANEGRGYLFRRILRRAARFGRQLGFDTPFLHDLTAEVVAVMAEPYPDLVGAEARIRQTVLREEERFVHTLNQGMQLLEDEIARVKKRGESVIAGEALFTLYDTYGFPVDLAGEVAAEAGLSLDLAGFEAAMAAQRERARRAWVGGARYAAAEQNTLSQTLRDAAPPTTFTGYTRLEDRARLLAILKENRLVASAKSGDRVALILDKTPFYAEAGGQVGDSGRLLLDCAEVRIDRTEKLADRYLHHGRVVRGAIERGADCTAAVDPAARHATARNHTATHLLHAVLREVLGDHVKQAGSLVAPDRLRFDFHHFAPLTPRELDRIETAINDRIIEDMSVQTEVMATQAAVASGAVALFGEKYGDKVRVVSVGDFSRELCGGTHCRRIGEIGLFKIVKEGSVAAGIRRIEAVTGSAAFRWVKAQEATLRQVADLLKGRSEEVVVRAERLLKQLQEKERELARLRSRPQGDAGDPRARARRIGPVSVLAEEIPPAEIKTVRAHADHLRDLLKSGIIIVGAPAPAGEKVALVVMVTPDFAARYPASRIAKALAEAVGGSGGGRAEMAQAGGKEVAKLSAALAESYRIVEKMVGS